MLGDLEAIENSEYNNAGALYTMSGVGEELLGALSRMNEVRRKKVINKLSTPVMPSKGSRAEMEKHFSELPDHIRRELLSGGLRLADALIYSVKPVQASKTIKMFETQDVKEVGIRNVSNAKLPKNQALLVSGIVLLAGISTDQAKDNVMSTSFKELSTFPAIVNGEFDLKANKKVIVPETSNYVFKTANNTTIPFGYYKLSNPRLILDDIQIELTINLGTIVGLDPNTQLFVGLHGTITTP